MSRRMTLFESGVRAALLATVVALCAGTSASAQPIRELRYDARIDVPVSAVLGATWLTSELFKARLAAEPCRWCDETLNPVDRAVRDSLRWQNVDAGDTASSVVAFGLVPLTMLGMNALAAHGAQTDGNIPIDALLVVEAVMVAANANQLVKYAVGRERPFVHALAGPDKLSTPHPADNNTSFYSGHTNLAFALATSAGTVASLRGYRWAKWVWVVGLTLATASGYLRIAGDRHYFTDVVVGAAVGSLIGFGTVWLFHRPAADAKETGSTQGALSAAPLRDGLGLQAQWRW